MTLIKKLFHEITQIVFEKYLAKQSATMALAFAHRLLSEANYEDAKYAARKILAEYRNGAVRETALIILGKALFETQNIDAAAIALEEALRLANNANDEAHFYLGLIHHNKGQYQNALSHYFSALDAGTSGANLFANIGTARYMIGDRTEAETYYRKAIGLDQNHVAAQIGLGILLQDRGEFDEALLLYDHVLGANPSELAPAFHKSQIHLCRKEFKAGFTYFQARPNRIFSKHNSQYKLWKGAPLSHDLRGKVVLVLSEQTGIGDDLFFARFHPELKSRGAHVLFNCDARCAEVMRLARVTDECVVGEGKINSDIALLAGDLPLALRAWENKLPSPFRMTCDTDSLAAARQELEKYTRPHIGVTWAAGTPSQPGKSHELWSLLSKTIPVDILGKSLKGVHGNFFVIQRNVNDIDLHKFEECLGRKVINLSTFAANLKTVSAFLSLLDEYVCVPNTHMHLRVATDNPCHILVPTPPEWRLLEAGDESIWYPECKLYRQEYTGDWIKGLSHIRQYLLDKYA